MVATRSPYSVLQLLALEADQRAQPHVDDRGGLLQVEAEVVEVARRDHVVREHRAGRRHAPERLGEHERLGDQARARRLDRVALADDRDDAVDVVERDQEAEQQVRAVAGLGAVVLGAPPDHFLAVVDEVAQHLAQREHARLERRVGAGGVLHPLAALGRHERQHVEGEARLQRRLLVELVEHHLRRRVAGQLDHDPHALAVGLVVQPLDAGDPLLLVRLDDRLDHARGRDLVGDLADDDLEAAFFLDDLGLAAQRDRTAAGLVRLADRVAPEQHAAGREVGALHDVGQSRRRSRRR